MEAVFRASESRLSEEQTDTSRPREHAAGRNSQRAHGPASAQARDARTHWQMGKTQLMVKHDAMLERA